MDVINLVSKSNDYGGITLLNHTKAVIRLAVSSFDYIVNGDGRGLFRDSVILSVAFHDIGKCFSGIQKYLRGGKRVPKIGHNVIGWAYLLKYTDLEESVLSTVLHHHTISVDEFKKTANDVCALIEPEVDVFHAFFDAISHYLFEEYGINVSRHSTKKMVNKHVSDVGVFHDIQLGDGCCWSLDFDENSKYLFNRSALVFSDREVSSLYEDTDMFINSNAGFIDTILHNTFDMINGVVIDDNAGESCYGKSERLDDQHKLLNYLKGVNHCIVGPNAGWGKTFAGVSWILSNKKKSIWVGPQNSICEDNYRSINKELSNLGLSDKVSVALFLTGRYVHGDENCDIIVTNIDNYLGPIFRNCDAHTMIKLIGSNVVFDEYHLMLCDEPLFAGFISIVNTRSRFTKAKTLLLSATPLQFDRVFWGCDNVKFYNDTIIVDGDNEVSIKFLENDKLLSFDFSSIKNSMIVYQTISSAQNGYIKYSSDNGVCIHSLFTDIDRNVIEDKIYESHGKSSGLDKRVLNVFGTNIIGTGQDISFKSVFDFVITPEDTIQRGCGRASRFCEYDGTDYYVCIDNRIRSILRYRIDDSLLYRYIKLHDAWLSVLKEYDGKKIKKRDLYSLYYKFYDDNRKDIRKIWVEMFNISMKSLREIKPYSVRNYIDDGIMKIPTRAGLRGDNNSIFVTAKIDGSDEVSDVIVAPEYVVSRERMPEEYDNAYMNNRMKSIMNIRENAKYDKNLYNNILSYAKYSDTPFRLYGENKKYSHEIGLILK